MKVNVFWQNLLNLIVVVSVAQFLTACGGSTNPKYKDTSELEQPPQVVSFTNIADETGETEAKTVPEKESKKGLGDIVHTPDETSLIIDKPFDLAWLLVNLALKTSGMEISDRNRDKGQYYVEFDPDTADLKGDENKSLFSTIFLTGNKYPKARYLLTFYENPRSVKVEAKFLEYVDTSESSNETLSDQGVAKLLHKLYTTLHDELPLN